jgi:alpha-N-arabinofuranosidase
VNGWPGGIIQAGRHDVFVTPLYHANRMYASRLGAHRVRATVRGPTFDAPREGRGVPYLDAVASRSADGRSVFLKIVNTHPTSAIDARVDVRGAAIGAEASWELLSAPEPGARNSFAEPEAIVPRTEPLRAGRSFVVGLPARSVSVITLAASP